jgi:hypothetical protein
MAQVDRARDLRFVITVDAAGIRVQDGENVKRARKRIRWAIQKLIDRGAFNAAVEEVAEVMAYLDVEHESLDFHVEGHPRRFILR